MIKSIRIKNFKSLRDVEVELGPLTVLIGRSGGGKSNFVNALGFLRDCLLERNIARNLSGAPKLVCVTAPAPMQDHARAPQIGFCVQFDAPGFDGLFQYDFYVAVSGDTISVQSETLQYQGTEIFSRAPTKWLKPPSVVPIPSANQLALQTANGIPEVAVAYHVLTGGIGCYSFQGTVLQQRPQGSNNNSDLLGLTDDASNYLQVFQEINRNLQDVHAQREIIAAMRQLKPGLKGIQVAMPGRDKVIVSLSAAEQTLTLDLSQESEGFRRFLAHLLAIYQLPPKQLLVFDEPEKGLYPGALSALAEQFRACPEAGRGQVILATHNPALLDHFQPDEIRVVDMDQFETRIGRVSKPQIDSIREQLMTTGELLTVDPARIEATIHEPT